jgi:catechol 2,3-dioxygenase-like lactoylglutathione lyase family enzyme
MLGNHDVIAFVASANPERAKEFYGIVLGLKLVADTPFALVFDAHGTMLRIAKVHKLSPAPYTVLGWEAGDIRNAMQNLAQRGVVSNVTKAYSRMK